MNLSDAHTSILCYAHIHKLTYMHTYTHKCIQISFMYDHRFHVLCSKLQVQIHNSMMPNALYRNISSTIKITSEEMYLFLVASSQLLKNLHHQLVFDEEWILTAEEIFQEEVYKIAMKYSAGAVQTESLLMSTEAVQHFIEQRS